MSVEAPLSRHKKNNLKIYIGLCIVLAVWFGYDGYFNEKFREKHADTDGNPDAVMVFNQKASPGLACAGVLLGSYLLVIRNRKIVAEEKELVISAKERIGYDSIQQINRTHFESKGFFVITYQDSQGNQVDRKLGDRNYDNLGALLDELVAKIS
ncbi:MAG: hypothetical protein ACYSUP_11785 [Planctomycetota bacterium]|jgi:hypothetical protein